MTASITLEITTKVKTINPDTLVVGVDGSGRLPTDAEDLREYYAHLVKIDDEKAAFTGKWGQILNVPMPQESNYARVILVGLKSEKKHKTGDYAVLGAKIAAALKQAGTVCALVPAHDKKSGLVEDHLAALAEGMQLGSYVFKRHKAAKKDESATLTTIGFDTDRKTEALIAARVNVAAGVALTRDLGNEPPNLLYPESFAKWVERELKPLGVKVEIFDDKDLTKYKMGGILGVGQGSARPPRLVIMTWSGGKALKKGEGPIALVGKGVTFDTGGIDIKPASGMEDMKFDMCGAGAVVGTIKALALNKAKVNVIGAIGLAENMPSHNAMRPSDIITSHAGKTVEVLNTDAEGRLVLMDVLSYIQKTYHPSQIVDLATLTGAIVIALGNKFAGAFVNNDRLWAALNKAADEVGEPLWRMPLDESFRKSMEGSVSDLQNLSGWDRGAGSCTAAGFLEHFIENDTPWAHLDIAGTAYGKGGAAKGPTGFGVRLLYEMLTRG